MPRGGICPAFVWPGPGAAGVNLQLRSPRTNGGVRSRGTEGVGSVPHVVDSYQQVKRETVNGLLQLGGLILVALVTMGPVFGLLLLLNRRDRHCDALLEKVWERIPKELSSLIAVQVSCALFSSRSVVTVDMQACSRDEIWEAIARWSPHLPPRARLLVKGTVDRGPSGGVTLEATGLSSASCPPRRFAFPG